MITDYSTCWAHDGKELGDLVYAAIKRGWQPLGGVAVGYSALWLRGEVNNVVEDEMMFFCQAIVKIS